MLFEEWRDWSGEVGMRQRVEAKLNLSKSVFVAWRARRGTDWLTFA